jgi:hypothetical protein
VIPGANALKDGRCRGLALAVEIVVLVGMQFRANFSP